MPEARGLRGYESFKLGPPSFGEGMGMGEVGARDLDRPLRTRDGSRTGVCKNGRSSCMTVDLRRVLSDKAALFDPSPLELLPFLESLSPLPSLPLGGDSRL